MFRSDNTISAHRKESGTLANIPEVPVLKIEKTEILRKQVNIIVPYKVCNDVPSNNRFRLTKQ